MDKRQMIIRCDDTSLQVPAEEEDRIITQNLLDELTQWCQKWKGRKEFEDLLHFIAKERIKKGEQPPPLPSEIKNELPKTRLTVIRSKLGAD
jgi:hypothetical protein